MSYLWLWENLQRPCRRAQHFYSALSADRCSVGPKAQGRSSRPMKQIIQLTRVRARNKLARDWLRSEDFSPGEWAKHKERLLTVTRLAILSTRPSCSLCQTALVPVYFHFHFFKEFKEFSNRCQELVEWNPSIVLPFHINFLLLICVPIRMYNVPMWILTRWILLTYCLLFSNE